MKRDYSKRKEVAPEGNKLFPLREDHISEGTQSTFDTVASPESVLFLLK